MEDSELDDVHVPASALRDAATANGLEWYHLPIPDISIPDGSFEDLWIYSGLQLRRHLSQGGNIVIHCKGGLGRTGTIAARLLVEFGTDPNLAIRRVRDARPGSIETAKQENYVRGCKKVVAPGNGPSPMERVLGCLLGGAVGDGFGYTVEFQPYASIQRRFGPEGIKDPVFEDGKLLVSDDTQMTLFTLEGLVNAQLNSPGSMDSIVEGIRSAYLDWFETQGGGSRSGRAKSHEWLIQQPEMHARRAPGNTCMSSLSVGGRGTIANPINESKGCGGVMRVAPIGLIRRFEPEFAFELAARATALTHGHPSGYLSAGMVAAIIRFLVDGNNPAGATQKSGEILAKWKGHEETSEATAKALSLLQEDRCDHLAAIRTIGAGWVGEEALAIALYAALSSKDYVETIRIAANHDGDSDSTASIAGQLWGAWKGIERIPHEWVTKLDLLSPLLHMVRQAFSDI
jgi:ADP-ribosylglycohydrolase